jgi:hypothetical protein
MVAVLRHAAAASIAQHHAEHAPARERKITLGF